MEVKVIKALEYKVLGGRHSTRRAAWRRFALGLR